MSNIEREIGTLLQGQRQQGKQLEELHQDVKKLNEFMWKVLGMSTAISAVVAFVMHLAVK